VPVGMFEMVELNNSCFASSSFRLRKRSSCSQNIRWSFCSQSRVRDISLPTSSSTGRAWPRNTISWARKDSMASTDVIWAFSAMSQRWLRYSSMRWAFRSRNGVCSLERSTNFLSAFIVCLNSSENFS
jgi:hypothetical protein